MIVAKSTLLVGYLFCILLFPNFYSMLDTRGAILLNIMLMILPIIFLSINKKNPLIIYNKNKISFNKMMVVPCYFILAIPFGMVIGLIVNDNVIIVRDFFEIHRPFYWAIIFMTSYNFFLYSFDEPSIRKVLIVAFLICATMGLLQFFQVNFTFFNLYIKQENYYRLRIAAPFPNPYDYGFVIVFFALYFLTFFVNTRKKMYLVLFILSGILVALTQSRSMFGAFVFANLFLFPVFAIFAFGSITRGRLINTDLLIFLIPFCVILIGTVALLSFEDNLKYLFAGFRKIAANPLYNGVTSNRIDQMSAITSMVFNNPLTLLFGNGPAKGELNDVESIYSYYVFRYGIMGLLVGFLLPALYASKCSKIMASTYHRKSTQYLFFKSLQLWFLVVPMISIANNHTEQIRVSALYILLIGLVAARRDSLRGVN
jgi:hypothetical protein